MSSGSSKESRQLRGSCYSLQSNSTLQELETQIETRLLRVEEKFRTHLLREQVQGFEEKVYRCYDQFNVDVFYRMFLELTKRTVVDVRRVKSISVLKQCLKDHKKTLKRKHFHRNLAATPEEEKIVKYFTWFWRYLAYLRELRDHFLERIFNPLFKYFYSIGYTHSDREDTVASSPSVLSFRSGCSRTSGFSGLTSVLNLEKSVEFGSDGWNDIQTERRQLVTRHALATLTKEFKDIKKLYDSSEVEKLAQRLSHLVERLGYLIDNEDKIDNKLLCQDSEKSVFHLKIKDRPIENLIRFVPDALIKFQKAAWLASRWLDLDDQKTKDLNERLDKLTALEYQMNRRLKSLSSEIRFKESELETHTNTLNKLLEREERTTNLTYTLFDVERQQTLLAEQLKNLQKERKELVKKLTDAANENDKNTYRRVRPLYDRNKLQCFALERQLATLNYHANLAKTDLQMELEVKPCVINCTNDVQDKCEELEEEIEKARREQKVIQAALIPILEDKRYIEEQVDIKGKVPIATSLPPLKAEFVHSSTVHPSFVSSTPDRLLDLNEQSVVCAVKKKPISVFLTSLPDEGHINLIHQPETVISSRNPSRNLSFEVMASEW